jgi:alpha-galactosidase
MLRISSALVLLLGCAVYGEEVKVAYLDTLDVNLVSQRQYAPLKNRSGDGTAMAINGKPFERGIGTMPYSSFLVDCHGTCRDFKAFVGSPRVGKGGTIVFELWGDEKLIWQSPVIKDGDDAFEVDADVSGMKILEMVVTDANDGAFSDRANWADAKLTYTGEAPKAVVIESKPYILTPKSPNTPRINGTKVLGVRPGRPVLYTIPATGERPMSFAAKNLPAGLAVDANTGMISGTIKQRGEYVVKLGATNNLGKTQRDLKIVCGDTICLTPQMGWNSWNCWGCAVDEGKIRKAADAMVSSGLVNHGWSYINIDDCWHGKRDANGKIQSNEKFPSMKALADYVHSKGLRAGLYTDAGPKTCAGFEGSDGHELEDILTYAEWGFDYVKIDWCFCEGKVPEQTYGLYGEAIKQAGRDIVLSLCNGGGECWRFAEKINANSWRINDDVLDTWASLYTIAFLSEPIKLAKYNKPGHWNDPDMLVVGRVGWGPNLRKSRLTADEQYMHISAWAMMSAPLLTGCDMTQLDEFTYNLLTNDEVIAIDQDPAAKPAGCIVKNGLTQVWARELEDGSKAVCLFNLAQSPRKAGFAWTDAGLKGKQVVRNVWKQQDIGEYSDSYEITLPRHGVMLVNLTAAK